MARAKPTRKNANRTTVSSRSPKAPARPASGGSAKPQARRRERSAAAAVRKDTMLLQTDHGPRVAWSASKPTFQKR